MSVDKQYDLFNDSNDVDLKEETLSRDIIIDKKEQKKIRKIKDLEERKERENSLRSLKRKQKKERIKELKSEALKHPEQNIVIPYRKKKRPIENIVCSGKIIIDCDFEHLMDERDIKSLFKEIESMYSFNHKLENPFELVVCGIGPQLRTCIDKHPNTPQWKLILFTNQKIDELIDADKNVIYLTAESDSSLDKLSENDVYIIGGFVDHKQYKNVCQNKAQNLHLLTRKLPIQENLHDKKSIVMATNHVFETLCRFKQSNDWGDALKKSIPKRYLN